MVQVAIKRDFVQEHIAFLHELAAFFHSEETLWDKQLSIEIEGEEFTKDNQLLLTTVANFSSMVMSNAQLFELTRKDLMSTRRLTQKEVKDKQRLKSLFSQFTSSLLVEQIMERKQRQGTTMLTTGHYRQRTPIRFLPFSL